MVFMKQTVTLRDLPPGQQARIVRVGVNSPEAGKAADDLEQQLLLIGFEEGASVELRHQASFGGPLAVKVGGRLIAVRPGDAAAVLVDPIRTG